MFTIFLLACGFEWGPHPPAVTSSILPAVNFLYFVAPQSCSFLKVFSCVAFFNPLVTILQSLNESDLWLQKSITETFVFVILGGALSSINWHNHLRPTSIFFRAYLLWHLLKPKSHNPPSDLWIKKVNLKKVSFVILGGALNSIN